MRFEKLIKVEDHTQLPQPIILILILLLLLIIIIECGVSGTRSPAMLYSLTQHCALQPSTTPIITTSITTSIIAVISLWFPGSRLHCHLLTVTWFKKEF